MSLQGMIPPTFVKGVREQIEPLGKRAESEETKSEAVKYAGGGGTSESREKLKKEREAREEKRKMECRRQQQRVWAQAAMIQPPKETH